MSEPNSTAPSVSMVATLAAGVAHEINNPTACILANVEHLLQKLRSIKNELPAEFESARQWIRLGEELLGETHYAAQRIRDIVAELKRFSEPDRESRSDVRLNDVIQSALDAVDHELRHTAVVERQLDAKLPTFIGQPERLKQLFTNIITNAAQAIEGGSEKHQVTVRTWSDGKAIFAQVTDDGRGIASDVLPHVFTPFFTTKPVGIGMGIGLATAQDIAKKHGGEIGIVSQVGKGTTVEVRFPLFQAAQPAAPKETVRRRVLLVDDEPHLLKAMQRMIGQRHDVAIALGGRTALDLLKDRDFDLVVSDMMMPEIDGVEVFEQLARMKPGAEKKLVFATGGVFTNRVREFFDRVPNRRVQKPFTPDDIFALIDEVTGAPLPP